MKDLPILFTGPMVRAILDGRKTVTRRVVKPQPVPQGEAEHGSLVRFPDGLYKCLASRGRNERATGNLKANLYFSPFGDPGDRLWVRETHYVECAGSIDGSGKRILYRATDPEYPYGWTPSIHMPRWASRISLEVTEVRVERLQEITEEDAIREGVQRPEDFTAEEVDCYSGWEYDAYKALNQPLDTFRHLWDSINAKRGFGWDANPWVWVIGFRCLPSAEGSTS